ncbi:hypothetical protein FRC07_001576 [Ceratobasidium sp. 392]|nr:hypothetical protein FRC07_001576 [Ceratobasidium sp. 392]
MNPLNGLANGVCRAGGVVIYIGWRRLQHEGWAKNVDLHVKADVDEWSKSFMWQATELAKQRSRAGVRHKVFPPVFTPASPPAHTSATD